MFDQILNKLIFPALNAVVSWFSAVTAPMEGFYNFFFGIFMIICVYRFVIAPLLGGKHFGSDKAKHTKNDSSSKKQADNMEG